MKTLFYVTAAAMIGLLSFESDTYLIDPDSSDIVWVKKTWWGIKEVQRPVRWFDGAWQAKNKSGRWYPFLVDYDESGQDEPMPVR